MERREGSGRRREKMPKAVEPAGANSLTPYPPLPLGEGETLGLVGFPPSQEWG